MQVSRERAAIEILARMIDQHVESYTSDSEMQPYLAGAARSECTTQDAYTRSLVLGQYIDALMDSLDWSPQVKRECRELLAAHGKPKRRRFN